MTRLKKLFREPLVQFLLLGALLFVYFEWKGGGSGPGSTRISITPGLVEHLASGFAKTWQRPPTESELKGLIDEYVKEEIATREATAMGLDRDDTIIRRRLRQKMEFLVEDAVEQVPMLAGLPDGLLGLRDRALLLLGFAAALRRSELVALNVEDVAHVEAGLEVTLRRSKTDQEAAGRKVGVPFGSTAATCPARAVRAWLEAAGITSGPLLRAVLRHGHVGGRLSGRAVARTVQRRAEAVGLNAFSFGGHSLRAGLATAAAKAGKSERAIMAQTGHRSVVMVRRYIRDASLFSENAALGLL